jgi:hypothetical protein
MDMLSVKIYSHEDVPRLRYIAGIILGDILGLSWDLITDKRKLGKHPVINYSDDNVKGAFNIFPGSLLFEKGISSKELTVTEWKGLPVFFQTAAGSDIPFDIFAASFFLLSRYEEYLENTSDDHGRYKASSSLAYKNGFLLRPVIDFWAKEFSKSLLKKFQTLAFRRNEYKSLVTIDTDQPFAYLGKSLLRSIGGLINDIRGNRGHASERYRTITKGEKDPFEVFDYLSECIEKFRSDSMFFFPVGNYSKFDKNPSWTNDEYRALIISLSERFSVGIHPSYYAADNQDLLNTEVSRLKTILGKDILSGRYHYIRLFIPASYRNLCAEGITGDYSMGYPEEPGFRAGIARPYTFYDVLEDKHTDLKIIPFQIMDATLYQYKQLSAEASKEIILKLINETRKAGGIFVSIWHNTSLQDNEEWKCWREVFEFMLKSQA